MGIPRCTQRLVSLLTLQIVQTSLSVDPMFRDPREDVDCANMFGDSSPWRAWDSNVDGSLDVRTIEDVRFNRTKPYPMAQLGPIQICLGSTEQPSLFVFRTVPKSGSQSVSKFIKAWPNTVRCPSKHNRENFPALSFAFVRHPYSRLVSGFHTIIVAMAHCKEGSNMYTAIGEHCDRLKGMSFWKRYAEMAREPQFGSSYGRALVNFTRAEVLECFELFVQDTLSSIQHIGEKGRNGVEPLLHHVRSQTYFLSLRMRLRGMCRDPKAHYVCNPQYGFVGKLEELKEHYTAMLKHYAPTIHDLAPVAANWTEESNRRELVLRDSQPERFVDQGGKLVEEALPTSALKPSTMDIIKNYYAQDMTCFRKFYSWDKVEIPHWHSENQTATDTPHMNGSPRRLLTHDLASNTHDLSGVRRVSHSPASHPPR